MCISINTYANYNIPFAAYLPEKSTEIFSVQCSQYVKEEGHAQTGH
jgi:hypothetical protein